MSVPTLTLKDLLVASKLTAYESALENAGYDDLAFLQTRTEQQLKDLAVTHVKMPIGHAERFAFAVVKSSKATAAAPPLPTPSPAPTNPAEAAAPEERRVVAAASPTEAAPKEETAPVEAGTPSLAEAVAICIDRSYSMKTAIEEMRAFGDNAEKTVARRSRMDAVKQIFYAFRDRTDTLDTSHGVHQLGLIQFDDKIDKMLDLTSSLNAFESIVDDVRARGSTAIYSVISSGVDMLRPVFEANPQADLRVLVLTDGESNHGISPQQALERVNEIGATVDAIIVGDRPDPNLRRIVELTGGACFNIRSLSEGFQLMESEAVVSLRARRGGEPKPAFVRREMPADFKTVKLKTLTRGTAARSLARAKAAPVMKVASVAAVAKKVAAQKSKSKSKKPSRVIKELQTMDADALAAQGIHILPDADNPTQRWRVLLEGPSGSPFEGGVFALRVNIPSNYPFSAPTISFETPIYHCNVSDTGRICMEILYSGWSPSLSVVKCLNALKVLLNSPNTDNALRSWIAELTIAHTKSSGTDKRYVDSAKKMTADEASLDVAGWKKKLGIPS